MELMSEDTDSGSERTTYSRRRAMKTLGASGLAATGVLGAASGTAAAEELNAVVDMDPIPAVEGETATFDGSQSTGNIEKYEWYRNAADGSLTGVDGTGETFTETFAEGVFKTKLVVTDVDGNTDSDLYYFEVHSESRVQPTARIRTHRLGDGEIVFDGALSSAPGDGSIVKYEWYRNASGYSLTGVDGTGPGFYEHFASGDFDVKLEVTDSTGRTDSKTITITV